MIAGCGGIYPHRTPDVGGRVGSIVGDIDEVAVVCDVLGLVVGEESVLALHAGVGHGRHGDGDTLDSGLANLAPLIYYAGVGEGTSMVL